MVSIKKQTKNRKTLVLLDAHAIIHRAYHALPDFSTSKGEPTGGLYGVAAMLIKIINELKPDYIVACYDLPKPTFRHDVYKEYKAGRAEAEENLVSQIIRSRDIFKAFNIPIYEKEGFEADDILGTIVEELSGMEDVNIVIASGDMDTLQLVDREKVRVYTLRKGLSDTIMYNEKAVKERFGFDPALLVDFKGLRGDPSDNIIGIAGIGEKTATTLIQNFGSIEDIYKKLAKNEKIFEEKGIKPRVIGLLKDGEEEAFFSKTLATIRRDAPISFALPNKKWTETFDESKVGELFSELEFRTLLARVKEMFGNGDGNGKKEKERKKEKISDKELKKTAIGLWLLHSDTTNPELEDILLFARTDSFIEAQNKIEKEIKNQGLTRVYEEIELPLISIIKKAEERGIRIDKDYAKKLSKKYHKELSNLEGKIWKAAGEKFNINSPKQLGGILFDKMNVSNKGLKKTAGGARSTRESELLKIKDEPIVADILAYRELQKLLSTYIDNIPEMVDAEGILHTTLNQTGTTTGRFSSTNPNLQNIPACDGKGEEVRNMFVSEKGFIFASFDYSQIEMRILAVLSGDPTLLDIFQKGEDVHTEVAERVFGVKESEVTKDMRRVAKVINFGIVYGMGVNALRANLGGTRAQAQEFYNNYFEKFPKVAEYFEKVKKDAARSGFTQTFFGRKRYFDGITSKIPFIRAMAERQALNAPIQGTAADIIKMAMRKVDEVIQKEGLSEKVHLILQVHDELIYEIEESILSTASEVIKKAIESVVEFPVPLTANILKGKRWGELK